MMKKNRYLAAALLTASILTSTIMQASAEGNIWAYTTYHTDDGSICIDFEEVEVLLPESWSGKCQMSTYDNEVTFYHLRSRELYTQALGYANGGRMFSVCCSQNYDFLDTDPSYQILGTGGEGIYYLSFPTDVQGYTEDAQVWSEFEQMSADVSWIAENVSLTSGGTALSSLSEDSIFPQSSTEYLESSDLETCSPDELQMAINEIYARHHRRFVLQDVQEYFDSKSWYTGYIEAEDFDVSVMNGYEGYNIDLMVKALQQKTDLEQASGGTGSGTSSASAGTTTLDAYGMIIEAGDNYFRVRQQDGSALQVWYDSARLADLDITAEEITVGATVSLIYDGESYEALNLLIW